MSNRSTTRSCVEIDIYNGINAVFFLVSVNVNIDVVIFLKFAIHIGIDSNWKFNILSNAQFCRIVSRQFLSYSFRIFLNIIQGLLLHNIQNIDRLYF